MSARWQKPPPLREVVEIEASLEVHSPLAIGGGDSLGDNPILRDQAGRSFIPGTSLAGALRAALAARRLDPCALLGGARSDDRGDPSALFLDDAMEIDTDEPATRIERRDHVRIDPGTATAMVGRKYERERVVVGTRYRLHLEWRPRDPLVEARGGPAFVALLQILADGLSLGAGTRRGMGTLVVAGGFRLKRCDIGTAAGLLDWLVSERQEPVSCPDAAAVAMQLGLASPPSVARREGLSLELQLAIADGLIVRGLGRRDGARKEADASTYARPGRGGRLERVIPATSLVGALRHRCLKICAAVGARDTDLVEYLFGGEPETERHQAGRLRVEDAPITDGTELRHARTAIDPWVGGARDGFLFDEDVQFGGRVTLVLSVDPPPKGQELLHLPALGLLAMVLRDLWEGDLPVGGEASIGRGVLRGRSGELAMDGQAHRLAFDEAGSLREGAQRFSPWVEAWTARVGGVS
jgi:hypothetical protein